MSRRRLFTVDEALATLFTRADNEFYRSEGEEEPTSAGNAVDVLGGRARKDDGKPCSCLDSLDDEEHFLNREVDPPRLAANYLVRQCNTNEQSNSEDYGGGAVNLGAQGAVIGGANVGAGATGGDDDHSARQMVCGCQRNA